MNGAPCPIRTHDPCVARFRITLCMNVRYSEEVCMGLFAKTTGSVHSIDGLLVDLPNASTIRVNKDGIRSDSWIASTEAPAVSAAV